MGGTAPESTPVRPSLGSLRSLGWAGCGGTAHRGGEGPAAGVARGLSPLGPVCTPGLSRPRSPPLSRFLVGFTPLLPITGSSRWPGRHSKSGHNSTGTHNRGPASANGCHVTTCCHRAVPGPTCLLCARGGAPPHPASVLSARPWPDARRPPSGWAEAVVWEQPCVPWDLVSRLRPHSVSGEDRPGE